MSRIANMPVVIPTGVEVLLDKKTLTVKGKKGELTRIIHSTVEVKQEDNTLLFAPKDPSNKEASMQAGTTRSLVNSMVIGVSEGFTKRLKLIGVGYRAQLDGKDLLLNLGFSHPIKHKLPDGIEATCATQTDIAITGSDKQLVGQTAAKIRGYRKPEPYKGKGIRYADEIVRLKETKKK